MSADGPAVFLGSLEHPLDALARLIITRERSHLPDLSGIVVLLPDAGVAEPLRERLLFHANTEGVNALLPPFIGTPESWLAHTARMEPPASAARRTLSLLEVVEPVLTECLPWLGAAERLALARELRSIFDGWEQNAPPSLQVLVELLARNYGAPGGLAPMTDEARLVFECWRRWQSHLGTREGASLRRARLAMHRSTQAPLHTYVCGFQEWDRDQAAWLAGEMRAARATFVGHAPPCYIHELPGCVNTADLPRVWGPADEFLKIAFQPGPVHERVAEARRIADASPIAGLLHWHEAAGFEEEVRAAVAGTLSFLADGARTVGIVSMDRKLARRIRAVLEDHGVLTADSSGWRLSTTSAAEALRVWWRACADSPPNDSFSGVAASPFFPGPRPVSRATLDQIAQAAAPLRALLASGEPRPIGKVLAALYRSIEQCALAQSLERDEAGRVLLAEIGRLADDARRCRIELAPAECFAWLTDELDARRFSVGRSGAPVRLLGLAESRLYGFDGVVLAGADAAHCPGESGHPLFFNEAARRELGLPSAETAGEILRLDFLRLLQAAPRVLITWRRQDGERALMQSPWLERLRLFHELAYGADLTAMDARCEDEDPLEPTPVARPAPIVPRDRLPLKISARAHQRLIECPYQYFAAEVLHLRRRPEPDEDRSYTDYGEHVHRILEAFHHGAPGLPGPFGGPLTAENRAAAADLLAAISTAVFEPERDFSQRLALNQWLDICGPLLDWEIEHGRGFSVTAAEANVEQALTPSGPVLFGRIDRIDTGEQGTCLIDYKTGVLPRRDRIQSGEQTQLAFYSVLAGDGVRRALLLGLKGEVETCAIEGPELVDLAARTTRRVLEIYRQMTEGAPLPAHGTASTCAICDYEALCRRPFWTEDRRPAT
ncbi:MAG: PD-(D/E)XK nuclease family protein [Acidiferrobacteraceae bacterium]